jgi:hypothetical protein
VPAIIAPTPAHFQPILWGRPQSKQVPEP